MERRSFNKQLGGELDRSPVTAIVVTSGNAALDLSKGNYFTLAPTANVTAWTITGKPASGIGQTITIEFTQDTTARTVAWDASFKWPGGVAHLVSTGSGAKDLIAATITDGSTFKANGSKAYA